MQDHGKMAAKVTAGGPVSGMKPIFRRGEKSVYLSPRRRLEYPSPKRQTNKVELLDSVNGLKDFDTVIFPFQIKKADFLHCSTGFEEK